MAQTGISRKLMLAGILALAGAPAAMADVIDGDWCFEGRHFSIKGPAIVTPEGTRTSGDYTRHSFSYVVPAPAARAGATISMRLLNETTLRVLPGADPATPEQIWRRCDVTS
jgi:hypothetical protein